MRALIVDVGQERSSVSAARALVAEGWEVGCGSESPDVATHCRAVSRWHHVAHTAECDELFLESLDGVVRRHRYDVAFVTWDKGVDAVSAARDRLSFPVGYGPHEGVREVMDKERMVARAQAAGLATPRTFGLGEMPEGGGEAVEPMLAELGYPVIVKPAATKGSSMVASVCDDAPAALAYARRIAASGGSPIAQQYIDGGSLMALTMVVGDAGTVTVCQQLALHVWPQPAGVTARGITLPVDGELRSRAEAMLAELDWRGLVQLQFLVGDDGIPRLLDLNPRFYGSLALAVSAGANHPDAWARVATGRPVTSAVGRPGATYQWFSRDLRVAQRSADRPRELARTLLLAPTAAHTVFSWRDPWVSVRHLAAQGLMGYAKRTPVVREGLTRHGGTRSRQSSNAYLQNLPATPSVRHLLRTRRVPTTPERVTQRVLVKLGRRTYEEAHLRPLQAALAQERRGRLPGPPRFLVRVDEFPYASGHDEPRYGLEASRAFHAVLAEEGVPHLMAVVPQWTADYLNPAGAGGRPLGDADLELLEQMRTDGVTFAQHGTTHRTRFRDPRRHSELSGLSPAALSELLDGGRRTLAAIGIHPRILVPPFNRFDARQWPTLAERYDVITGGPESIALMGFHNGPQWRGDAVYLPCYAPFYERAEVVLAAVERALESEVAVTIPIVLHTRWEVDDDFAALRRLARRVAPVVASWEDLLARVDASRTTG